MVFEKVAAMIAERLDCEKESITPETAFEELGIDSLDVMELLMLMEDEFGAQIEMEEQELKTVGDVVKLIELRTGAKK